MQRFWYWFIEPSLTVTERDQRRQATLLTGLVLGSIALAGLVEIVADLFLDWANYTGYRQTILAVALLFIVYMISRTRYWQSAATLLVVVVSLVIFAAGWAEPRGVLTGLFDFLIIPLWLGSLFIDLKKLLLLIVSVLIGLLVFPLLIPTVSLNTILVGPFTFTLTSAFFLLIITHHRNRLEHDRQAELSAKEQQSRRDAARAEALLRVAERLNAQLDLETVLEAIGEEIARALNTPLSVVALYDHEQHLFYPAAGVGLSDDDIKSLPVIPRTAYDTAIGSLGPVFALPDIQPAVLSHQITLKQENLRSIAFAAMEYDHDLIGSLSAITIGTQRDFTNDELLLLRGLADQAALALVNTRLYKDAFRRLERLQALRTIELAIATNRDLCANLTVLLENITVQLRVDGAVFLLLNEDRQQLEFATSLGFHTSALTFSRLRLGEGMAGRAAQWREIMHVQDLRINPQFLVDAPMLAQEGFVGYVAAPLIAQGQVKGVLELFHRSPLNPDKEWLSFLDVLASQAAIAITSTTLFEDIQRANGELTQAYDSTIEGWSRALDLRDKETEGHTQRVTKMTVSLARAMGFGDDELAHIRRGALLHDIGKMGVPDHILLKPGKLTDEEWVIMQKHPVYAYELLFPITYLRPALDIPYCHHEKWDGTGYPRGLKGEQIPLAARIFAIVDVYDALTSDRPYRKAWSKERTIEHIRSLVGTHFDPQAVEMLLRTMPAGLEGFESG